MHTHTPANRGAEPPSSEGFSTSIVPAIVFNPYLVKPIDPLAAVFTFFPYYQACFGTLRAGTLSHNTNQVNFTLSQENKLPHPFAIPSGEQTGEQTGVSLLRCRISRKGRLKS
jgi:hypothetical protein